MKRAAIYARYSSDQQRPRSIDDQVELCRSFAERAGFAIAGVYSDYELSGATVHRPEFARLQLDAEAGAFDVILAENTDRLARGEGDMPQLRRRMEFAGVEIHTCSDGQVTKMIAGLKGLTASMLLDDLAQHTWRGLAGVVRDGRSAGGRAYGYRPVPGKPGELSIEESEAAIVRRIFAEYLDGRRPREIAAGLNAEGVAPPRGARWNASTINGNAKRGNGIILNPLYAGRLVWNRTRMVKNPSTGRRVSRPNAPDQHQAVERPQLAIVERDAFDRAGAIKAERAQAHPFYRRRPPRLLSGLLRCGCCGGTYQVRGGDQGKVRVACSVRTESGACSNARTFYVEDVERKVLQLLGAKLRDPKYLSAFVAEYNATRRRLARTAGARLGELEKRAGANAREIERAIDAIVKGLVDQATMKGRMQELTQERDRLAAELDQAKAADQVVTLHPEAIGRYCRDVEQLAAELQGEGVAPGAPVERLRRLIEAVVIHAEPRRAGKWEIEIKGRLAALVGGQALDQWWGKVVAGKRYRLAPPSPLFLIRSAA